MTHQEALDFMKQTGKPVRFAEEWSNIHFRYTQQDKVLRCTKLGASCADTVLEIWEPQRFLDLKDFIGFYEYVG